MMMASSTVSNTMPIGNINQASIVFHVYTLPSPLMIKLGIVVLIINLILRVTCCVRVRVWSTLALASGHHPINLVPRIPGHAFEAPGPCRAYPRSYGRFRSRRDLGLSLRRGKGEVVSWPTGHVLPWPECGFLCHLTCSSHVPHMFLTCSLHVPL